jgi:hypothetical protein
MGITTGLMMSCLYGSSLMKRLKVREEKGEEDLKKIEEELGSPMFDAMMKGIAFAFILLSLLFAIVVLSLFQDALSIGSMAFLLISTVNEVIRIMDFKHTQQLKKQNHWYSVCKNSLIFLIYSSFTGRLLYSIF